MARPGPRPKDAASKKSVHVGLRITPRLHERLSAEAEKSECSLSHEIEVRLRRSLEDPEQEIKVRFGGPTSYWLFLIIANLVRRLESYTQDRWWRDAYTHRQMKILVNTLLDRGKPAGRARTPTKFMPIGEPLGQHLAERELDNVGATLLDPDPPVGWNWGGMTVTEWRKAAEVFKGKLNLERPKK